MNNLSQKALGELLANRLPSFSRLCQHRRSTTGDLYVCPIGRDDRSYAPQAGGDCGPNPHICQEAATHDFASVCINPTWVPLCTELLADAQSVVCTVIGFPLGATLTATKVAETREVVALGAREVDMVMNIGRLKDGDHVAVAADIAAVVEAAHGLNALVKVIIETCLLSQEEKIVAALLTQAAGADFVKTSTGFNSGGATVDDVRLLRLAVGPAMGVKAAGGVRSAADALQMIGVGATRLGASAGVKIVESLQTEAAASTAVDGKEMY
ncbi:MAG: deoxyribose-phosphate aldolase [Caldilineaceae bacterium]